MKKAKVLLNPFEGYSENRLIVVGVIALMVGSLLGFFVNGRFDGVLDLHFIEHVDLWDPFIDNLINVTTLFLIFTIIGKFINRKTRYIDILAVALTSRIPIYLISLINIGNINVEATKELMPLMTNPEYSVPFGPLTIVLVFGLISIILIAWFGTLIYNGFKVSTHAKGWNLIIGIVLGIILAETLSKFIFFYFL